MATKEVKYLSMGLGIPKSMSCRIKDWDKLEPDLFSTVRVLKLGNYSQFLDVYIKSMDWLRQGAFIALDALLDEELINLGEATWEASGDGLNQDVAEVMKSALSVLQRLQDSLPQNQDLEGVHLNGER